MVRVLLLEWRSNEFWQPFPPTYRTVRAMWRETTTFENCRATHRESEI